MKKWVIIQDGLKKFLSSRKIDILNTEMCDIADISYLYLENSDDSTQFDYLHKNK